MLYREQRDEPTTGARPSDHAAPAAHVSGRRRSAQLHCGAARAAPATVVRVLSGEEREEAFDVALLDRIGKRVAVTEVGQLVFDDARQMLNLLIEAALAIDQLKGVERGTLRVGGSTTVGVYESLGFLGGLRWLPTA
jgi:hypothetical protein